MQFGQGCAIGIDFGTTNSVVAVANANGHVECMRWPTALGTTETFRSALMFWREGRNLAHAAGPEAIARALAGDGDQRFVQSLKSHLASRLFTETRLFGTRLTIEDLVAIFLRHLFRDILDDGDLQARLRRVPATGGRPVVFAGEKPDETLAIERLGSAYAAIGLPQINFAYEPLGAAYWYARALTRDETVLVADFGGGTSDFSVLRFTCKGGGAGIETQALAHSGVGVAGDTFDYRIIDHVVAPRLGKGSNYRSLEKLLPMPAYFYAAFAQWHQLSWLKSAATLSELKALAGASTVPQRIEDLVTIVEMDLGFELHRAVGALKAELSDARQARFCFHKAGVLLEADVSRDEFEGWIAADLDKIAVAMDAAVAGAGLESADIDAVFMTGGTSFVPAIRRLFTDRFGKERIHLGDAFQSVASGLALLAADRASSRA
ncbi:MAG TPA: Hsp70 family protein [Methylovirgula sp.]